MRSCDASCKTKFSNAESSACKFKINLSLECGSRCASQKKPLWDSSKTYSPKGFTFRDVQLMPCYNDKLEEERLNNSKQQPRNKEGEDDVKGLGAEEGVEDVTILLRDNILQAGIHTDADKCQGEEEA